MLTRSLGMSLLGILILFIALFPNKALAFEPSIDFNAPDWVEERESADNDVPELPRAGSLFGILFIALFPNKALAFEPSIDFNAPDWVEERESADNDVPELPRAGSLFGSGDRPLFSDRRAMKPDDLITIVINETANANFTTNKN